MFAFIASIGLLGCTPKPAPAVSAVQASSSALIAAEQEDAARLDALVNAMSDRELVGQLLITHLRWDSALRPVLRLNEDTRAFLSDLQPGGIIFYSINLDTVTQTRALVREIQQTLTHKPFLAIDEEGGRVSRLRKGGRLNATHVPPARSLAAHGSEGVRQGYTIIAQQMRALGFNMNLAPVLDLDYGNDEDVIGDRAFSGDPALAAGFSSLAMKTLQDQGIVAVLKHFPGHGRALGDTHVEMQRVRNSWADLLQSDLVPFVSAFEGGAKALMTAHVIFEAVDSQAVPVSLSEVILKQKLRDELGYKGLIITDALEMKGVRQTAGPGDLALRSVLAGVDMLLGASDSRVVRDALLTALETGRLARDVLRERVRRIVQVKHEFGILYRQELDDPFVEAWAASQVGNEVQKQSALELGKLP